MQNGFSYINHSTIQFLKEMKMNRLFSAKKLFALLLVACSATFTTNAQAQNWVKLGDKTVRLVADHDVIPVTITRGQFRRVKFKVRNNGVFINQATVVYGNGENDVLPIRFHIAKGGESRAIDLRGRVIRRIELSYRSVRDGDGRAVVEAWGMR
jgi:hypothetical protein